MHVWSSTSNANCKGTIEHNSERNMYATFQVHTYTHAQTHTHHSFSMPDAKPPSGIQMAITSRVDACLVWCTPQIRRLPAGLIGGSQRNVRSSCIYCRPSPPFGQSKQATRHDKPASKCKHSLERSRQRTQARIYIFIYCILWVWCFGMCACAMSLCVRAQCE